jgi:hypothetical protein
MCCGLRYDVGKHLHEVTMTTAQNIKELQRVIDDLGLSGRTQIKRVAKSLEITVEGALGKRKIFAACTPSNHRNYLNVRLYLRRAAIEAGAIQA